MKSRLALLVIGWIGLVPLPAWSESAEEGARRTFFENHIRPLLEQHCLECHSRRVEEPAGGLRLDSRAGWEKGGELGPAILPGSPDASLLIEAVEQKGDRLRMPPEGRLSAREIEFLRQWIAMGAPDPREEEGAERSRSETSIPAGPLWSFQPLKEVRPPAVSADGPWSDHPIDRFLWQQWQTHGLKPVPLADRVTLIRRVTIDLTGLPPTPAEIDQFVNDGAFAAYERLVDRLLSSPRYGERWGRFWLDVARYADSNGLDENIAHGNAWRYRDYVIAAWNQDKPYDAFVKEQIAGDKLPASENGDRRHGSKIATGFLSLGPKVLAEVDETKMEMDIVDEQVEAIGRAFMALTLGCARCHDHKFDPVTTADYYGLAGIFKSTQTMEHFRKIARWREVSLADPAQQAEHDRAQQEIAQAQARLKGLKEELAKTTQREGGSGSDNSRESVAQQIEQVNALITRNQSLLDAVPSAMSVADYERPCDLCVHIRGNHLTLGKSIPRRVPVSLTSETFPGPSMPAGQSGRQELAEWLVDRRHPLTARVLVNRIWRWHFGRGLVSSTDNFGALGELPINQDLLDWLAAEFQRDGWSLKRLHRLILTSRSYRLASTAHAGNLAADPANQYQWRFSPRRLEVEAIHDSLLSVGGLLDETMGGSLLHVKNREFLFDHTSKDATRYDAPRRAVYLPVIRNHLFDMFQLFDYTDASVINSDRATTTVAPQALFFMNSELTRVAASALANRLIRQVPADRRLIAGYRLTFGRTPTAEEQLRDTHFLKSWQDENRQEGVAGTEGSPASDVSVSLDRELAAWSVLCHAWLNTNEFIYVR